MARITFTPVVYGQYRLQDGNYTVRMRVTHKRKTRYLTTSETASPDQLTKKLAIKDDALLLRLRNLETKMRKAIADLDMYALEEMDVDQIVSHMRKRINGDFRLEFFSFWEQAVASKAEGSRKNYIYSLHNFQKFMGCDTMDISRVTSRLLRQYEGWLVERYGKGARAVSEYLAALRHVHALARAQYNDDEGEPVIRNPFEYYRLPKQMQAAHRDVDASVIQGMIDARCQLKGRERKAVDAFLLSFALMGMNARDLHSCRPPEKDIIIYNRSKTRDRRSDRAEIHVLIDERIRPLYEDWKDDDGIHAFRFWRENINGRQFNSSLAGGLAQYCQRAGIKGLSFYSARHSWASLAHNSAGIDKGIINDCLCHSDAAMRVTDIYIRKDWSVLWRANAKVLDMFEW